MPALPHLHASRSDTAVATTHQLQPTSHQSQSRCDFFLPFPSPTPPTRTLPFPAPRACGARSPRLSGCPARPALLPHSSPFPLPCSVPHPRRLSAPPRHRLSPQQTGDARVPRSAPGIGTCHVTFPAFPIPPSRAPVSGRAPCFMHRAAPARHGRRRVVALALRPFLCTFPVHRPLSGEQSRAAPTLASGVPPRPSLHRTRPGSSSAVRV